MAPKTFVGPLPPSWRKWSFLEDKCPPNSLYKRPANVLPPLPPPPKLDKCPPNTTADGKCTPTIHCTNVLLPLPPLPKLGRCPPNTTAKANVLQLLPTTTARISQMQNLITNDGFTYIQPLLLRAAGSLREFPSCSR